MLRTARAVLLDDLAATCRGRPRRSDRRARRGCRRCGERCSSAFCSSRSSSSICEDERLRAGWPCARSCAPCELRAPSRTRVPRDRRRAASIERRRAARRSSRASCFATSLCWRSRGLDHDRREIVRDVERAIGIGVVHGDADARRVLAFDVDDRRSTRTCSSRSRSRTARAAPRSRTSMPEPRAQRVQVALLDQLAQLLVRAAARSATYSRSSSTRMPLCLRPTASPRSARARPRPRRAACVVRELVRDRQRVIDARRARSRGTAATRVRRRIRCSSATMPRRVDCSDSYHSSSSSVRRGMLATLAPAAAASTAWSAAALAAQPPRAPSRATSAAIVAACARRARARRRAHRDRAAARARRARRLVIRSGTPPTAVATTRRPLASASSTTFGVPSTWLGSTSTSHGRHPRRHALERLRADERTRVAGSARRELAAQRAAADDRERRVGQRARAPSATRAARSSTPFSGLRLPT